MYSVDLTGRAGYDCEQSNSSRAVVIIVCALFALNLVELLLLLQMFGARLLEYLEKRGVGCAAALNRLCSPQCAKKVAKMWGRDVVPIRMSTGERLPVKHTLYTAAVCMTHLTGKCSWTSNLHLVAPRHRAG
jgi:hypothetical protein